MSNIIPVYNDDPEMNAAAEEAQRRFPEFRSTLEADWNRKIPIITRAIVKAKFQSESSGKIEHMWVEVLRFEGEKIVGELANASFEILELREGQEVFFPISDVSD
jgi:uncharacterized protein YegJ (DUF2314 family)